VRILDQRFMVIRQAVGVPKSRGNAAMQYLAGFVQEMSGSGFVARSLTTHHIDEAEVLGDGS
jgi:polar amino acid transport system substrate-binding protein